MVSSSSPSTSVRACFARGGVGWRSFICSHPASCRPRAFPYKNAAVTRRTRVQLTLRPRDGQVELARARGSTPMHIYAPRTNKESMCQREAGDCDADEGAYRGYARADVSESSTPTAVGGFNEAHPRVGARAGSMTRDTLHFSALLSFTRHSCVVFLHGVWMYRSISHLGSSLDIQLVSYLFTFFNCVFPFLGNRFY